MLLYELFSYRDLNNVEATLQSLILLDPGSMADQHNTTAFAYEVDPTTGTDQQLMHGDNGNLSPVCPVVPRASAAHCYNGGAPCEVPSPQGPRPAGVSVRHGHDRGVGVNGHSQALAG